MLLGRDIGIDLGTTSVLLATRGKGVILREPSVVAMDKNTGRLLSVGLAAQRMLGRTPGNIVAIRPLRAGAISDYDMTERMLRELVRKAMSFSLFKPRVVISVPSGISEVEERAVIDAGIAAGARRVYLMEAPLAAALGSGLDISKADGNMVVDIGGGTTDVAVLSLNGVVESDSIKGGGDGFDDELIKYIRKKHNVLIGDNTAEELKKSIGCVFPRPDMTMLEVKGRCLLTGLPRVVTISTDEVLEAFGEMSERIIEVIHSVLENTPPELVADVSQNGIVLTGGGSLLWGFDKLIESRTHIPTRLADDAEQCVAYGLGKSLAWVNDMSEGTINLSRRKQMRN
jgi:rod shape-determining protein MreB